MPALIDITKSRFGLLLVKHKAKARSKASAYWLCACDCGNEVIVAGCKLKSGHTRSCGCLKSLVKSNYKHGQSRIKSRTYRTWKEMRQRCLNRNSDKWKWYGGRGITIYASWLESFENFLEDMGERPEGKTLDRIDAERGYDPSNCRWANAKTQGRNQRGFKLDEAKAKLIRERIAAGERTEKVADDFGISREHAWRVGKGGCWA